ncbi:CFI-box-CTERM domain-containing protein [Nitrosopumilus sp.]|uniref:CFI-box-CTERM domain-containing protein n=1 Tax=Nitrosopumilus sp. TaxID=2024843 RepID=UPI003D0E0AE7
MKMKLSSIIAITLLSISILSYGANNSAFAANSFIEASSSSGNVGNGDPIVISGSIVDFEDAGHALTFTIISPDNSIVQIGQVMDGVSSDGTFEMNLTAGGPLWKTTGEYTVKFFYGPTKGDATVDYTGGDTPTAPEPEPTEPEPEPTVPEPEPEPTVPEPEPEPTVPEPEPEPITCGAGTEMVDGICQVVSEPEPQCPAGYSFSDGVCVEDGGGCLIATAAYGTELAPQIQLLREVRDNTVLSTTSGATFMTGFNTLYYSFAPTVADWERENPMFKESVRAFITPMISTLSIMTLADDGSEVEVLGLGISVIALNLAMYIAAPALIGFKVHKSLKSRK